MTIEPRQFKNAKDAIDKGFEEGAMDRRNGAKPENLASTRELWEAGYKWERGPGAPFYEDWRRGYDAGFCGNGKPTHTGPRNA
jgi:hypothetical protein